jgi:hypothetical protein
MFYQGGPKQRIAGRPALHIVMRLKPGLPGQSFNLEWGRGPFGPPRKEAGSSFWELEVQPLQQSETQQAVENQEQRYDEVEESRHDQDQNARNERDDRRDVGDRWGI